MPATSPSLLDRLQNDPAPEVWRRWLAAYEPWLRAWLDRHHFQPADVEDLLQNILTVVAEKLRTFIHNGRQGSFRAWLRAILVNQVGTFLRARRRQAGPEPPDWLDKLEDPASELSRQWDQEHDQQVVRRLLAAIRSDFEPGTWEVFRLLVLEDRPAAEVARRCGVERNAVYAVKHRVLTRLRQELRGLVGP